MKCPPISLTVMILNIIVFFYIINWKKIYTNRRHYSKCRLLVITLHLWCIRTSNKLSTSEPLTTSFMQAEQQLSGRQLSMHVFGRLVLWSHIPPSLQTDWKELWSTILLAGTNSRFYRVWRVERTSHHKTACVAIFRRTNPAVLAERMTLELSLKLELSRFRKSSGYKRIRACCLESILRKRENGFQKCRMCISIYSTCVLHGIVQS